MCVVCGPFPPCRQLPHQPPGAAAPPHRRLPGQRVSAGRRQRRPITAGQHHFERCGCGGGSRGLPWGRGWQAAAAAAQPHAQENHQPDCGSPACRPAAPLGHSIPRASQQPARSGWQRVRQPCGSSSGRRRRSNGRRRQQVPARAQRHAFPHGQQPGAAGGHAQPAAGIGAQQLAPRAWLLR